MFAASGDAKVMRSNNFLIISTCFTDSIYVIASVVMDITFRIELYVTMIIELMKGIRMKLKNTTKKRPKARPTPTLISSISFI